MSRRKSYYPGKEHKEKENLFPEAPAASLALGFPGKAQSTDSEEPEDKKYPVLEQRDETRERERCRDHGISLYLHVDLWESLPLTSIVCSEAGPMPLCTVTTLLYPHLTHYSHPGPDRFESGVYRHKCGV